MCKIVVYFDKFDFYFFGVGIFFVYYVCVVLWIIVYGVFLLVFFGVIGNRGDSVFCYNGVVSFLVVVVFVVS